MTVTLRAVSAHRLAEPLLVLALFVLALVLRLPDYMVVPTFSDETREVERALSIARGELLPRTNVNPRIGPLFNYLVAGVFWTLDPGLAAGRMVALACGVLTVIPTYLLGRSLGGPTVGAIAGLLLVLSPVHILVNSHIAYSHSILPLFTTFGLWLLHRAASQRSGISLVGAGLAFGLALQAHPTSLAIWPGLAVYLLLRLRAIPLRWLLPSVVAGAAAAANLIAYNLRPNSPAIRDSLRAANVRVEGEIFDPWDWLGRLGELTRALAGSLGGFVRGSDQSLFLADPLVLLFVLLTLAGLVILLRGREWLPGLVITSGLLATSLLSGEVIPVVDKARNWALLLPPAFVCTAVGLLALARWSCERRHRSAAIALTSVVGLALMVGPAWRLQSYYAEQKSNPSTNNQALLQVLDAIERSGSRERTVYVDEALHDIRNRSAGHVIWHVVLGLRARRQELDKVDVEELDRIARSGLRRPIRLILSSSSEPTVLKRYRLEPLPGDPGDGAPIRAFLASPRGPA